MRTILLVGQPTEVRHAMGGALAALGLHVLQAASIAEATSVLEESPNPVRLVIAHVPPDQASVMKLVTLGVRFAGRHPGLTVLEVSGEESYPVDELAMRVSRMLDRRRLERRGQAMEEAEASISERRTAERRSSATGRS
jgi:DNA-binding NtrC family response regulator